MANDLDRTDKGTPTPVNGSVPDDLTMKGRFTRYNSPFLQLMIPLLTTRYLWLAIEDINPFNVLDKPPPPNQNWKQPGFFRSLSRNFASLGIGGTLLAVMSYYSKRTYEDIRTLYAEAIGYELDKKPQDVTLKDIFFNSENAALKVTREAFIKRTLTRFAAGASFFIPWHRIRDYPKADPKYDANVNAGVGVVGAYLSLDGFVRKPTFFETEQDMVSQSVNHANEGEHELIQAKNIQSMLMLQRRHLNKDYTWPKFNSAGAQNESVLASRIAELMNQTYNNVPRTEQATFTIGKFNYLVGFGLLDKFPTSLAYVELANKSTDMKEVKAAAAAIKGGESPDAVFRKYGIDLPKLVEKSAPGLYPELSAKKFVDKAPSVKDKMPQPAKNYQDLATQTPTNSLYLE